MALHHWSAPTEAESWLILRLAMQMEYVDKGAAQFEEKLH